MADIRDEQRVAPIAGQPLPHDALIILPVRSTVLFPGLVLPISVGRAGSVAAAQQAVREQRQVGLLMQRNADVPEPAAPVLIGLAVVTALNCRRLRNSSVT